MSSASRDDPEARTDGGTSVADTGRVAPYERKETKTKFDYLAQWMFDAPVVHDRACDGCGATTTRLSRVRDVFGDPLCVSCWSERKRNAPEASADGDATTTRDDNPL